MVKISLYGVLTNAGQPVASRWARMWANVWVHYWGHLKWYMLPKSNSYDMATFPKIKER